MTWPGTDAVDLLVPRAAQAAWWERLTAAGARPAGTMAFEAMRVESLRPRLHVDTDDRTIPHEVGWIGSAVHLTKGCYRGQETVARVANLGRPPRRLVLLHLDGGDERLPLPGDPVLRDGRAVGRVGTVALHGGRRAGGRRGGPRGARCGRPVLGAAGGRRPSSRSRRPDAGRAARLSPRRCVLRPTVHIAGRCSCPSG
jgi:folate-binding protein YgfZ